jgi:ABC-type branched-subunit amino acid transport system ATPase component
MDLPAGQVIARVGHNGSGKTTLAKLEVQRPQPALSYCFIRNAAAATARPAEDHPGGCQGHVVRHRGARAGIAAAWNVPWRTPAPCERAPGRDETGLIRFHGMLHSADEQR